MMINPVGSLQPPFKLYHPSSFCLVCLLLRVRRFFRFLTAIPDRTLDSPRWLISKDRTQEAIEVLNNVRTKKDVTNGVPLLEVAAIVEDNATTMRKAPWQELFNKRNIRRTVYATTVFLFLICMVNKFQDRCGDISTSYGNWTVF